MSAQVTAEEAPFRLSFAVPGRPQGKGRPRFVRATGHAYTPEHTASYEAKIAGFAQAEMLRPPIELGRPIRLTVTAAFLPPASWSRKKRDQALLGMIRPTGKPDIDNLAKVVGDSLNGVVWHDDQCVVEATVRKVYAEYDELRVLVETIEPEREALVEVRRARVVTTPDLFARA